MTVSVLLFASYADALGRNSLELPISAGETVANLVSRIRSLPGGSAVPERPLVAVNLDYARMDLTLAPGDELALIPPVAGG